MNIARCLAAAVVGMALVGAAPQAGGAKGNVDDWNAWNGFPEGAWVTMEQDMRGEFRSTRTLTLIKKTADRLTVKRTSPDKQEEEGDGQPALRLPGLPGVNGDEMTYERNPKPFPCPTCRAPHKPSILTEQKKEKLRIGSKEVLCLVMDVVPFDCKGVKSGSSRWWMSKEVPGGLAKREWTAADRPGKVVDIALDFDKKKVEGKQ